MTDKQPVQAAGEDGRKGAPDGVNDPHGKQGGGESAGGAYPNPQTGKAEKNDGFMSHGGQTEIDYSGSKGGEGNAVTEGED
ncbi:hypothetical protein GCM10011380_11970 [Sphingomonas metalli]|jgi:hypothetical protein|uniref:Uncharacterized protein n=1 Tax=Sphingomonas metalli TaxID=1779358 RepID=A0A916SYY7_9SPHN|nr:hypothetical protein [Sphingomonas metalli]GGB23898.1 hypothetical protein GCM10011380_11970 [Sphingomonas metalli]